MFKQVRSWLDDSFAAAEEAKTCLFATCYADSYRLRAALAEGAVVEAAPGMYARPAYWSSLGFRDKELHKLRAHQAKHPDWVFAGPSAALVHGLSVSRIHLGKTCVATSRKTHRRSSDTLRSIVVKDDEVVEKDGVRVTSLLRTTGDCLRVMEFGSALALADSAVRAYGKTAQALSDEMSRACFRMAKLQQARAVLALADGRAESGGESIARAMMLELGVALPDLQRELGDPLVADQQYRADFAWDVVGGTILGEMDGNEKYTNAEMTGGKTVQQVIEDEHRRQSHVATICGVLRIIRFGYKDIRQHSDFLKLLCAAGVPRSFAYDDRVVAAGGTLRCR